MQLGPEIIAFLMTVAFLAGMIDAIAGGGGLLTIPALMAVGVPPVAALATNKLQSTFGTGGAVFAFARKGHIDLRRFALPATAAFAGSAGGAFAVTQIDPAWLAGLVPILLVAILLYFLFGPRLSDEDRHSRAGPTLLLATALLIGAYDGFFGPGTGSFFTTALVAVFGLGMVRAIAHTKLLNLASNLAALIIFVGNGDILWVAGLAMALANVAGGQVGTHAAMRFGGRMARPLLIIMSLGLTAKLLSDPANPLTALIVSRLS